MSATSLKQRALGGLLLVLFLWSDLLLAKPNFVVLLVDDGGFMDFGGYGGEAQTPNIDRIADRGIRFSNYHTSPLCAPSRAMLLTGLDSHRTGVGTIPEVLTEAQQKSPAYALRLQPGVQTIADRLKTAGYQTFMTGKWHLGRGPGDLPDSHGFDRSFALDASGADNWEQKSFLPFYEEAPWYEDGESATLPDDFYSSRFLVDKMIEYLEDRDETQPFLAYLAFQAVHIPVQAPREFTEHYRGVYADGWDDLRERRFARARELGLVTPDALPPLRHPAFRPWSELAPQERARFEASMMVNAGMLEAMDHHVGRLVAYLEARGELDNTVFIVTSDNGPEFGDPTTDPLFRLWMRGNGYHTDLAHMGEAGYMGAIGPEWASAAAVPGSLFKMYASEGGTRVPLIISGPGIAAAPGFNRALNFVTDLAPTMAQMAGLPPGDMQGRTLAPLLTGTAANIYGDDEAIGLEVAGNSALFKGDYKLTRNTLPHGDARWRLHDLRSDPAEVRDLSADRPALRDEMMAEYEAYAAAAGVIKVSPDFDVMAQVTINTGKEFLVRNWPALVAAGLIGASLLAGICIWLYRLVVRRGRSSGV